MTHHSHSLLSFVCEKMCMKIGENRWRATHITDVVRGHLIYDDMNAMAEALQQLVDSDEFVIGRCKDRFSKPTKGGWADCALNIYMKSDRNRHKCEIQIVHRKLMKVREDLHEHDEYAAFRSAAEVIEIFGD